MGGTHFQPALRVQMLLMLGRVRRMLLVEELQTPDGGRAMQLAQPEPEPPAPNDTEEGAADADTTAEHALSQPWVTLPVTHRVGAVIELLMRALHLSMSEGGHDRPTMQAICLELAALYQAKLVHGLEKQHQLEAMFFV